MSILDKLFKDFKFENKFKRKLNVTPSVLLSVFYGEFFIPI